jgi:hypothetical protein
MFAAITNAGGVEARSVESLSGVGRASRLHSARQNSLRRSFPPSHVPQPHGDVTPVYITRILQAAVGTTRTSEHLYNKTGVIYGFSFVVC